MSSFDSKLIGLVAGQRNDGRYPNAMVGGPSIRSFLHMLRLGASGETLRQIVSLVGEPSSLPAVTTPQSNDEIHVANHVFLSEEKSVLEDYKHNLQKTFGSVPLSHVDFSRPFHASNIVNQWVDKNTSGMIPRIVEPDDVRNLQLMLANATAFAGKWEHPFDPDKTSKMPFHLTDNSNGEAVEVDMMKQRFRVPFRENEATKILALPYQGGSQMVVVAPNRKTKLGEVEKNLSIDDLTSVVKDLPRTDLALRMPKFSFATRYSLRKPLISMGMVDAFGPRSDLSKITGDRSLAIGDVLHAGKIDVDEQGTKAAAATVAKMMRGAYSYNELNLDRPFLFWILSPTGVPLFSGRVGDPSSTQQTTGP